MESEPIKAAILNKTIMHKSKVNENITMPCHHFTKDNNLHDFLFSTWTIKPIQNGVYCYMKEFSLNRIISFL